MRFGNIDAFFVCENGPSGSLLFDQHHWGRLELLASGLTGVALSLNLASAVSAVLLGAPGVCSLWLLKLLWK